MINQSPSHSGVHCASKPETSDQSQDGHISTPRPAAPHNSNQKEPSNPPPPPASTIKEVAAFSSKPWRTSVASRREEPMKAFPDESGRERLKRHRVEVAGRVWIPDIWGQEELLSDWIDCAAFDTSLAPRGIMSARKALAEEGRRTSSTPASI